MEEWIKLGSVVFAIFEAVAKERAEKRVPQKIVAERLTGFGKYRWNDGVPLEEKQKIAFFAATFVHLGALIAANSRTQAREREVARAIMKGMKLSPIHKDVAWEFLRAGEHGRVPVESVLNVLHELCGEHSDVLAFFLELQLEVAFADGEIQPTERTLIRHSALCLGLSNDLVDTLERQVRGLESPGDEEAVEHLCSDGKRIDETVLDSTEAAYLLLGIDPTASPDNVARAFRLLVSRFHPDRLASKGVPAELLERYTERTRKILSAFAMTQQ